MEDDIISASGFFNQIDNFVIKTMLSQNQNKWKMIEFSELGFIGKLFRCSDLPIFMHMFLLYSFNKPVDLIHNIVFEALACDPGTTEVEFRFFFKKLVIILILKNKGQM